MNRNIFAFLTLLFIINACSDMNRYYEIGDFSKMIKIDAHIHIWTYKNDFIDQALKDNFKAITIMVDHGGPGKILPQYEYSAYHVTNNPDDIKFITTFEIAGLDEEGWLENTFKWIDSQINSGASGVKVWKNIGMEFRDKDGNLVMIDDSRLDPVFKYLSERKIPVLGHLGEPKNCWLPLEEMTTSNDRNYFTENPQYHMYLHPEFPSYDDQIAARDNLLRKNPDLIFIGAHLGSLEWDLNELAKRLDMFPNMAVDLSARMGQLFHQTSNDRKSVRDFFIKYQDRLLYGTDFIDFGEDNPADFQKELHETWLYDWKYFISDEKMTSPLTDHEFKGLKLPKEVIDKLYYENAKKWYGIFN